MQVQPGFDLHLPAQQLLPGSPVKHRQWRLVMTVLLGGTGGDDLEIGDICNRRHGGIGFVRSASYRSMALSARADGLD
jgi:hypothetical protein